MEYQQNLKAKRQIQNQQVVTSFIIQPSDLSQLPRQLNL